MRSLEWALYPMTVVVIRRENRRREIALERQSQSLELC